MDKICVDWFCNSVYDPGRASCLDYPAPTCAPSGNSLRSSHSPYELCEGHEETLEGSQLTGGRQRYQKQRLDERLQDMARSEGCQQTKIIFCG